jgi:hypothetical protein
MKKISLILDEKWFEFIQKVGKDVYEGEVFQWLSVEDVTK